MIRTVNPIPNETATVDIWHADGTFLRGTQLTDRNGQVRFAPYSSHAARDTHPLRTGGTAMTTIDLTPIDTTDRTWAIARRLSQELDDVRALHLDQKGRGRALRRACSDTDAAVVAYMDVDLSTDLDALLPLIAPLVSGHSDLAIGTRLAPGSRVVRGPRREVISRIYNLLLKVGLHSRFSDAQCGFKAVRSDVVRTARDDLEGIWRMRRQRASLRP
jgi:Glycosyl transferase family 2